MAARRRPPLSASVERVIRALLPEERKGWRAELARKLAVELDERPQAAASRELRAVMGELTAEQVPQEASPVDDLARRRADRIAAAKAQ